MIYARVSDLEAHKGERDEKQVKRGIAYATDHKLPYHIFRPAKNESASGDDMEDRPSLQTCLDAIQEEVRGGKAPVMWVSKLDRISRHGYTRAWAYRILQRNKVPIVTGEGETYDLNNPSSKLQADLKGDFAEYEASIIKERLGGEARALKAEGGMP